MSGPGAGTNEADDGAPRGLPWRGFWGRLVIAVVITGLFVGITVAMIDRGFTHRVQQIRRVKLEVAPAPPGGANFLIIGSDSREALTDPSDQEAFGSPAQETGQRSDTMMVAHVEPGSQKTFVVSFPRDLMVDVPGVPGKSQINSAYSIGGPQLVIDTLRENFGIEINHYLQVDFKSFEAIVDTIGAVRIYFPDQVRDQYSGLQPLIYGPGCYDLNGGMALAYVRSRHLEKYVDGQWEMADANSDLERIQRQQYFIKKLAGLAIQKSLSDPFLGKDIADSVIGYLKADTQLNRDDVNALIRAFKTVDVYDPNSVRFETLPTEPYPPDNNRLQASPGADQVVEQLRTFGDNAPPPATVQPSQVRVQVVDGTSAKFASSAVSKLTELGFKATAGPAARRLFFVTEVHYEPDQAAAAKALLAYLPDAKLVPDAKATNGLEVILGASFHGDIEVPTTTTTAPASTVPGEPTTAAPPRSHATTSTTQAQPVDPCPPQ
jgi:LCP family protein required for cell wall assembly